MIEMTLAHAIENKTEAAYRRGEHAAKRRALLTDWKEFLETGKTPTEKNFEVAATGR